MSTFSGDCYFSYSFNLGNSVNALTSSYSASSSSGRNNTGLEGKTCIVPISRFIDLNSSKAEYSESTYRMGSKSLNFVAFLFCSDYGLVVLSVATLRLSLLSVETSLALWLPLESEGTTGLIKIFVIET